jgi:UDP-glucuronate 4-epimerase
MVLDKQSRILVTGAAGFIGFHLSRLWLEQGLAVHGLDNLNDYYDPRLKQDRLALLEQYPQFTFTRLDLKDKLTLDRLFAELRPDYVVHLAAQAGVRYSIDHPYAYLDSNLTGFLNILEACRQFPVRHLLYASSSSVYGGNSVVPFSTRHPVDHPVSLYAATKKANELMAHTYSHLYNIPTTGLRFFTVYGPWGRPDMAYFSFTKAILAGEAIKVFNQGQMERDFTYIDDIVAALDRLLPLIPVRDDHWNDADGDLSASFAPYKIYNIGNNQPEMLGTFIAALEAALGQTAVKTYLPMQPGDVTRTYADTSDLERDIGFKPHTSIQDGLGRFVTWYREYYSRGEQAL